MKSIHSRFALLSLLGLITFSLFGTGNTEAAIDSPNEGAWLGVQIQDLSPDLRQRNSLPTGAVFVVQALRNSPADYAGLHARDILVAFDGQALLGAEHLRRLISRSRPQSSVNLAVLRRGRPLHLSVQLGAKPDCVGCPSPRVSSRPLPSRSFPVTDGFFGARTTDLTWELGDETSSSQGAGVLVLQVCEDSPAERAGLQSGDVLISANQLSTLSQVHLQGIIDSVAHGPVQLELLRSGQRVRTMVSLQPAPTCWR